MGEMEEGFPVLMSLVLRILDLHQVQPGSIPARGKEMAAEIFSLGDPSTTSINSDSGEGREGEFKLLRPLLPTQPPPLLSSVRGYDDLVKAIEDEKKAGRSKIVDLFE